MAFMTISVTEVLGVALLAQLVAAGKTAPASDARDSAGFAAVGVKSATRLGLADGLRDAAAAALLNHPLVALAARPKRLFPLQLVRYGVGDGYGRHMDDALMQGLRTDLAVTLFLSSPDDYQGGELVLEDASGEQAYKLPAGAALVYSAGFLHRVAPVTAGERLALIGWIESSIRDAQRRELLLDLELARRELFVRSGKDDAFDRLSRVSSNLLRMWSE